MLLSVMGMYEYDNTILDGITVPEGMDREALIDNILIECAELEVLYSRADTMKLAVGVWSKSNQYTWKTLYDTTVLDYNPIWNVDADITDTETITGGKTEKRTIGSTGQDKRTLNLTDTDTPNLTDTQSVKGFNSTSWAESEKKATTGSDVVKRTGTDTLDRKDNVTDDLTGTDESTREYTQKRTGNIGVTTTQQMIEQERQTAEFNLIQYITDSFKRRFCVLVY